MATPAQEVATDPVVDLYTIAQVARMFSIKNETVRKWIREGKFPNAVKIGSTAWRIPRQDIVDLVERSKP